MLRGMKREAGSERAPENGFRTYVERELSVVYRKSDDVLGRMKRWKTFGDLSFAISNIFDVMMYHI